MRVVLAPAIGVLGADEEKPAALAIPSSATPYAPAGSPTIVIQPGSATPVVPATTPPGPAGHDKPGEMPAKPETPGQPAGKPDDAKTKEPIKPIHRPPAPATSPNPEEFKVRPNEAGKIRLSFNGQPWQPVLEWLATISGMSLDWQELPGDSVNLSTQRSYTVPEVRDLINRLLLARGFTLLCRGEVLTVAEIKKIDPSLVPRVEPADLAKRDPHEFVKVSFPLVSLVAETAAEELKPMLSPNGRLTPLNETNRLEVMDAVTNLRDIDAVLKQQQSDENQPRSFREFKLKHARAERSPPSLGHAPGRGVVEVAHGGSSSRAMMNRGAATAAGHDDGPHATAATCSRDMQVPGGNPAQVEGRRDQHRRQRAQQQPPGPGPPRQDGRHRPGHRGRRYPRQPAATRCWST